VKKGKAIKKKTPMEEKEKDAQHPRSHTPSFNTAFLPEPKDPRRKKQNSPSHAPLIFCWS
jgi:hypothetical protein